jgi:hypothetical protein
MHKLLGGALAVAIILVVGTTATAQTKNTGSSRVRMVRAHCTTGPCDQFFTFQGGSTLIRRARQPKLVTNRKLGKVRLNALQALGGEPIPGSLDAQVVGTIFYGQDLNAVCPLANTVVTGPFATSTMTCVLGAAGAANCSGTLFFIDFTLAACSDVSQAIQDLRIEVYEGGFVGTPERLIATSGINVLGRTPDCASGGTGCP